MKLKLGRIPENTTFVPEESGWTPMKEPRPWAAQLMALPIGGAAAVGLMFLWATPVANSGSVPDGPWLIGGIVGVVILHEMIHAALHPKMGASPDTMVGFWPSRLLFYAHYDQVLSRQRFIAILLGPFIVISLVPLAVAPIAGAATFPLAFASVLNGLLSCVDLLGVLLLSFHVPKNAIVRNKGWKTYYKMVAPCGGG